MLKDFRVSLCLWCYREFHEVKHADKLREHVEGVMDKMRINVEGAMDKPVIAQVLYALN